MQYFSKHSFCNKYVLSKSFHNTEQLIAEYKH